MNTAFTKGVILELESNTKAIVLDSYALDAKNIRIIAVVEDFDICILNFNIDTNEFSTKHRYDTISIVATIKQA